MHIDGKRPVRGMQSIREVVQESNKLCAIRVIRVIGKLSIEVEAIEASFGRYSKCLFDETCRQLLVVHCSTHTRRVTGN